MHFDPEWLPPRSRISLYWRGDRMTPIMDQGRLDLADTIASNWIRRQRTVEMRLKTQSAKWHVWDDAALERVEAYIRYDLNFDGYSVAMERLAGQGEPCSTEMVWKLKVRPRYRS